MRIKLSFCTAFGLAALWLGFAAVCAQAQGLGFPPSAGGAGGFSTGVQMPGSTAAPPPPPNGVNCQEDIGKLSKKRVESIEALNNLAKSSKGKLDPVAACPRFKALIAIERQFEAYMVKNKEWCNIPDEILQQIKAGTARDIGVGKQACDIAAQVQRAQKEQELGGGGGAPVQKLPAGPL
jgi:hypothetical protein